MSLPCGYKSNTETVAQYRKRCGPRPLGMIGKVHEEPRKPRKKGQPAGSKKHSDLYTDENPKGTIHGLKFATVKDAQKSVSKIKSSGRTHAHKIQAAIAMEQRAKAAGKKSAAGVYRKFINQMKKKTKQRNEGWSDKYKRSIDCNNPKGFSQKAHCAGRKKKENVMSSKLEELVGKRLTEEQFDEAAGKKDACYYKVKARYDVWPSAYASGALVKCRKVGAKNWGNKSKKEGVNEAGMELNKLKDAIKMFQKKIEKQGRVTNARDEEHLSNLIKLYKQMGGKGVKEGLGDKMSKKLKKHKGTKIKPIKLRSKSGMGKISHLGIESVDEARGTCWVGYQQKGMKEKNGRMVPNCVKEITELYYEIDGKGYGYTFEYINDGKLNEAEYQGRKVKLGKIMQGDVKKFKVYVKNPKGNVVKVNFGQGGKSASKTGGTMRIRKSNPKARANFRARHNCDNPGPRHKARYWACRTW